MDLYCLLWMAAVMHDLEPSATIALVHKINKLQNQIKQGCNVDGIASDVIQLSKFATSTAPAPAPAGKKAVTWTDNDEFSFVAAQNLCCLVYIYSQQLCMDSYTSYCKPRAAIRCANNISCSLKAC